MANKYLLTYLLRLPYRKSPAELCAIKNELQKMISQHETAHTVSNSVRFEFIQSVSSRIILVIPGNSSNVSFANQIPTGSLLNRVIRTTTEFLASEMLF